MGIAGVAFIIWVLGYLVVIYWALRIGNVEAPFLSKVFLIWLISFIVFFGINFASPKISYVSDEVARTDFLMFRLPFYCLLLMIVNTLTAMLLRAIKRVEAAFLLPVLAIAWSGLYWLCLLVDFRVEFYQWPFEVHQQITQIQ